MISAGHVASGALVGWLARSRAGAVAGGFVSHALGDHVPHWDLESRRFDIASAVTGVLVLALADGPLGRTTLGAVAAAAPDLEHVLRLPRPGGRKLYPSHRVPGWHRPGGVGVGMQLLAAAAVLGAVAGRTRAR